MRLYITPISPTPSNSAMEPPSPLQYLSSELWLLLLLLAFMTKSPLQYLTLAGIAQIIMEYHNVAELLTYGGIIADYYGLSVVTFGGLLSRLFYGFCLANRFWILPLFVGRYDDQIEFSHRIKVYKIVPGCSWSHFVGQGCGKPQYDLIRKINVDVAIMEARKGIYMTLLTLAAAVLYRSYIHFYPRAEDALNPIAPLKRMLGEALQLMQSKLATAEEIRQLKGTVVSLEKELTKTKDDVAAIITKQAEDSTVLQSILATVQQVQEHQHKPHPLSADLSAVLQKVDGLSTMAATAQTAQSDIPALQTAVEDAVTKLDATTKANQEAYQAILGQVLVVANHLAIAAKNPTTEGFCLKCGKHGSHTTQECTTCVLCRSSPKKRCPYWCPLKTNTKPE